MLLKIALLLLITHVVVIIGKEWFYDRIENWERKVILNIDGAIKTFKELETNKQFTQCERDKFKRVRLRLENLKAYSSVENISYADLKFLMTEYGIDPDD